MILVNMVVGLGLVASAGCAALVNRGMLRGSCVLWSMAFVRAAFVSVQDSSGYIELGMWMLFGWPVCLIYCGLCRTVWIGVRYAVRRSRLHRRSCTLMW